MYNGSRENESQTANRIKLPYRIKRVNSNAILKSVFFSVYVNGMLNAKAIKITSFRLPWSIVYEGQLSKVVSFLERCYGTLSMDNDIDGAFL